MSDRFTHFDAEGQALDMIDARRGWMVGKFGLVLRTDRRQNDEDEGCHCRGHIYCFGGANMALGCGLSFALGVASAGRSPRADRAAARVCRVVAPTRV